MATATVAAHAGEIKFTYGIPETFALKFAEPKVFDGQFGPRAMFTACDEGYGERRMWMDYEDGANLVLEMRRLGIATGEPMRVTKVKHPRGGGHGYLVERAVPSAAAPDNAPAWVTQNPPAAEPAPSRIEAQLAQSVQMVRERGPQVFRRPPAPPAAPPAAVAMPAPADSVLMAALKTAIDAAIEATAYAAHQGLTLAFGAEDIRSLASTVYINAAKGGR